MKHIKFVVAGLLIAVFGCTGDSLTGAEEATDQSSSEALLGLSSSQALVSPEEQGFVIGEAIPIEVVNCTKKDLQVVLDGQTVNPVWKTLPYDQRCMAWISSPGSGERTVTISGSWGTDSHTFKQVIWENIPTVVNPVIDQFIADYDPGTLAWDWGSSVFLYALERHYRATGRTITGYLNYLEAYHTSWNGRYPDIKQPDQCPPALSALALSLEHANDVGMPGAWLAIDYIKHAPLTETGAINHLGTGLQSYLYPESIWIDSMMMYVLLSVMWGNRMSDSNLYEFGMNQVSIFRQYLQDPSTRLFNHAYLTKSKSHLPGDGWFWLRGDGWGAAALVDILDFVPETDSRREALKDMFQDYMAGIRRHQLHNGLWDTILNDPGYAYMESSGSALVAYAMVKGYRNGLLQDKTYLDAAQKTFGALVGRMRPGTNGHALPGISWPTDAGPKWWYKLIPTGENRDYGLGAFILLADELYAIPHL